MSAFPHWGVFCFVFIRVIIKYLQTPCRPRLISSNLIYGTGLCRLRAPGKVELRRSARSSRLYQLWLDHQCTGTEDLFRISPSCLSWLASLTFTPMPMPRFSTACMQPGLPEQVSFFRHDGFKEFVLLPRVAWRRHFDYCMLSLHVVPLRCNLLDC